jgi:type I restriction enzyme R subunit
LGGAGVDSEATTRKTHIDKALRETGWVVIPFHPGLVTTGLQHHAVEEYPTTSGPTDYALFVAGRFLGIVEAKKLSLGPQNALVQAERYSRGVESTGFDFGGYRVPFLYATNGEVIWFHDVRHITERSRSVAAFHVPSALQERGTCQWV